MSLAVDGRTADAWNNEIDRRLLLTVLGGTRVLVWPFTGVPIRNTLRHG